MRALIILITLALSGCSNASEDPKEEIIQLMKDQEEAWNKGSLEEFMYPYWNSDSLAFIGSSGINYGWNKTLENYQRSYPNKDKMGRLEFLNLTWQSLGDEYYHINGKWTLYRKADTLSGHYSLVWKKINNQWKIINDHSS